MYIPKAYSGADPAILKRGFPTQDKRGGSSYESPFKSSALIGQKRGVPSPGNSPWIRPWYYWMFYGGDQPNRFHFFYCFRNWNKQLQSHNFGLKTQWSRILSTCWPQGLAAGWNSNFKFCKIIVNVFQVFFSYFLSINNTLSTLSTGINIFLKKNPYSKDFSVFKII